MIRGAIKSIYMYISVYDGKRRQFASYIKGSITIYLYVHTSTEPLPSSSSSYKSDYTYSVKYVWFICNDV